MNDVATKVLDVIKTFCEHIEGIEKLSLETDICKFTDDLDRIEIVELIERALKITPASFGEQFDTDIIYAKMITVGEIVRKIELHMEL